MVDESKMGRCGHLTYDEFNAIVNIKEDFKRVDNPTFYIPEYKKNYLGRHPKEAVTFTLPEIASEYSLEEILKMDIKIQKKFFNDIREALINRGCTHLMAVYFKFVGTTEPPEEYSYPTYIQQGQYAVAGRGCCDVKKAKFQAIKELNNDSNK